MNDGGTNFDGEWDEGHCPPFPCDGGTAEGWTT